MIKVSVIIPILNVAPYLRACLDSVSNQTLKELEILCIDAGSTDGSLEIQKEYASKDPRFILLDDDKKSTGYAKNLGITKAKGEYIAITESDDYIALDMFEKLYQAAINSESDIVKGNYTSFIEDKEEKRYVLKKISLNENDYGIVIDPKTDNRYFSWDMYTWTGIYKRAFLKQYNIQHNESGGASFQDVGFWFQTFCYASKIFLLDDYFYYYRRDNPNSSVNNIKHIHTMMDEYHFLQNLLQKDTDTWKRVTPAFYHELFRSYLFVYKRISVDLKRNFLNYFYDDMRISENPYAIDPPLYDDDEYSYLKSLLKSKQTFIDTLENWEADIENQWSILVKKISEFPYLILCGAGSHGMNIQLLIENKLPNKITAFCDNDKKKQEKFLNNTLVYAPATAFIKYPQGLFLITCKTGHDCIQKQLEQMGVPGKQIYYCEVEKLVKYFI